jgi:hypothetical protein
VFVVAAMGIATYLTCALIESRMTSWATRRQEMHFGGG